MKKTAIITGAGGNLGQASVKQFLKAGYRVVATISPGKSLGYDVEGEIIVKELDLSDDTSVVNFVDGLSRENYTIDAALLLVGGFAPGNIAKTDSDQIKKMMTLNFYTAFTLAKQLFLKMNQQELPGRILLVGSRPAIIAKEGKNAVAYALSKSLMFTLADLLNAENNSKKVVTNVIIPGTIDTEANRKAMPDANFNDWVSPEEIADNMLWLCSDRAVSLRNTTLKIYGDLKN